MNLSKSGHRTCHS